MKTACKLLALMALASALTTVRTQSAYAEETDWTGNVNVLLGAKALKESDWKPAHQQSEFGIDIDFKQKSWPVSMAIDLLGATGTGTAAGINVDSRTSEFNLGVRKIWDGFPHVRPFIGGGLAFVSAEAKVSVLGISASASGTGTGIWLGGGVYWTLGESFNLGFEAKSSSAKAKIGTVDVEAGGGHFGLLLGWHWG